MSFLLGQIVATPGVLKEIPRDEVFLALQRHYNGD